MSSHIKNCEIIVSSYFKVIFWNSFGGNEEYEKHVITDRTGFSVLLIYVKVSGRCDNNGTPILRDQSIIPVFCNNCNYMI